MKANNVVISSIKCIDGEKQVEIETYQVQCGACAGTFSIEQVFTKGDVPLTCPYCKIEVELPIAYSGDMILEHSIGE